MKTLYTIIMIVSFLAFVFAVFLMSGDFIPYDVGKWSVLALTITTLFSLYISEVEK